MIGHKVLHIEINLYLLLISNVVTEPITNPALTAQNNDDEDEDEIDLFGSDEGVCLSLRSPNVV